MGISGCMDDNVFFFFGFRQPLRRYREGVSENEGLILKWSHFHYEKNNYEVLKHGFSGENT